MKTACSILLLLVSLASPAARAQEAAKKTAYPLLLNISILEIDLDPSEDLEAVARDRSRVAGLLKEGKARKVAITQMHVRAGEASSFRIGNKVPIQVGSFPAFNSSADRNAASAPTIQYEEVGLLIEAMPEILTEDMVNVHLKIEIKEIDRSTGRLTPSIPLKLLQSSALVRLNERVALLGVNGSWLKPGQDAAAAPSGAGDASNLVVLLTVRRTD